LNLNFSSSLFYHTLAIIKLLKKGQFTNKKIYSSFKTILLKKSINEKERYIIFNVLKIINKNFNKKVYLSLLSLVNFFFKMSCLDSYQLLKFNYLKPIKDIFTKNV